MPETGSPLQSGQGQQACKSSQCSVIQDVGVRGGHGGGSSENNTIISALRNLSQSSKEERDLPNLEEV